MVMVVDKPPIVGGDLPPLPPFLRKRGGPERRTLIVPDPMAMLHSHGQHVLYDYENNWQTTIYHHMCRVTGSGPNDPAARWEGAHSSSRRYRQWLETYHYPSGIPPHVQFGGCIESGRVDPTFRNRWEAWARETFF